MVMVVVVALVVIAVVMCNHGKLDWWHGVSAGTCRYPPKGSPHVEGRNLYRVSLERVSCDP